MTSRSRPLIFCMRWGTRYGAEYVNRLYASCRRHITGDFQFVCFSDQSDSLNPAVDVRPLPTFDGVPASLTWTTWRKMSLWRDDLPADLQGREALFLDLDVVIVGSLNDLFTHEPGKYAVIENWTQIGSGIGNTSVFRYPVGRHTHVYRDFMASIEDGSWKAIRTEQRFISEHIGPGQQVFWPHAWMRSFKEELLPIWPVRLWKPAEIPHGTRIVVFHGKPDPDEAARGEWPAPAWKRIYKTIRPVPWINEHWK